MDTQKTMETPTGESGKDFREPYYEDLETIVTRTYSGNFLKINFLGLNNNFYFVDSDDIDFMKIRTVPREDFEEGVSYIYKTEGISEKDRISLGVRVVPKKPNIILLLAKIVFKKSIAEIMCKSPRPTIKPYVRESTVPSVTAKWKSLGRYSTYLWNDIGGFTTIVCDGYTEVCDGYTEVCDGYTERDGWITDKK